MNLVNYWIELVIMMERQCHDVLASTSQWQWPTPASFTFSLIWCKFHYYQIIFYLYNIFSFTKKNSWFTYRLLHTDFYSYVN